MKTMTILVLHLGFGGVEKTVSNLVNMLHDSYEIEIISTYKLYDTPSFPIPSDVRIKYLLPKNQPNKKEIKEAIRKKQPLRLLSEGFKAIETLYLRRKTMKEAIKTCRSDIIISTRVLFTEWLSAFGNPHSIKISQEHNHHNNDEKYIKRIVRSCKGIDFFLPVSRELTDFYSERIHNGRTKVIYIPHCLDYFPLKPSDYLLPDLVSIGRLSQEKGPLELIDVFSLIHKRCPQAKLHLIGDGPLYKEVKEKISTLHLESSIIVYGFQKHEVIHEILQHCSVYVMTSWQESFGLVLLEAQSFALPCVAFSSAQGAHEIIMNKESGYLIEHRNDEEMAAKVCELLEDKVQLAQMGCAWQNNAQSYSSREIRTQWLHLLNQI